MASSRSTSMSATSDGVFAGGDACPQNERDDCHRHGKRAATVSTPTSRVMNCSTRHDTNWLRSITSNLVLLRRGAYAPSELEIARRQNNFEEIVAVQRGERLFEALAVFPVATASNVTTVMGVSDNAVIKLGGLNATSSTTTSVRAAAYA